MLIKKKKRVKLSVNISSTSGFQFKNLLYFFDKQINLYTETLTSVCNLFFYLKKKKAI